MERCLWYRQEAANWNEALPLGNGRLGGMVFGGPENERIQLNEDSVWSGGFRDRSNPNCRKNLEELRRLIAQGKSKEAASLALTAVCGMPEFQRVYQTLGDLFLTMDLEGEVSDYRRELDLEEALCTVSFTSGGVRYCREAYISATAQVLVLRLTADRPGALNFRARIHRNRAYDRSWAEDGRFVAFSGSNGDLGFCAMLTEAHQGGSVSVVGEYLTGQNVSEAVLYFTAATTFYQKEPASWCRKTLEDACSQPEEALRSSHLREYRNYFDRTSLALTGGDCSSIPTDQRLKAVQEGGADLGLFSLYFDFGRYLLISSSRPGTQPANLQGIWNQDMSPAWDSKYTININTEMNYWPAESCGLPECHLPLFDLLERMYPHGVKVAREMYGAEGFVAHHNTDLWGDCAPQDSCISSTVWVMGAAWIATHIWEHYSYTLDMDFLKRYYFLMREASRFFMGYCVRNSEGKLVVSPTISPENTYLHPASGEKICLCEGCAMDSQIMAELFTDCLEAGALVGEDRKFLENLREMLEALPQPMITEKGTICEWMADYPEYEPGLDYQFLGRLGRWGESRGKHQGFAGEIHLAQPF